jgi:hypothetical protein
MTNASNHLALLTAAPACGFAANEILSLHSRLDRPLVAAFLQAASSRVADWTAGSVFPYISGDGFFDGDTPETARPGLLFGDSEDVTDDDHLFWGDLFAALALSVGVCLTLLPDL